MKKYLPFLYSLGTNAISFVISAITTFIVPKFLGATDYGYWQLYLFYISYTGIFHFGWNDGIYLRYGGKKYADLDKDSLYEQACIQLISQIVIAVIIVCISNFLFSEQKKEVLFWVSICMIITNLRSMFIYILQMTARIKEYAVVNTIDRIAFGILVVSLLWFGKEGFRFLIRGDLVCRVISLSIAIFYCKDIFKIKRRKWSGIIKEIWMNIDVGSKLMFANLASMLITGIVRMGIEQTWSIETFGKISLTLSISNFLIVFINSVGVVIYPMLRNLTPEHQKDIFIKVNGIFIYSYVILLVYYPLRYFISIFLPSYQDAVLYIAMLFPICIYEGKISLLYLTYLKALRKEKALLFINITTVVLSGILTIITTKVLKNLDASVLIICILIFVRSTLSELYLSKLLDIDVKQGVIREVILSTIFIGANIVLGAGISWALYLGVFVIIAGSKLVKCKRAGVNK